MGISFAHEYNAFRKQQKKLRDEYIAAGMTEEQVAMMYEFDKAQLARDCAFKRRTQPLMEICDDDFDCEGQNTLLNRFHEQLSSEFDTFYASRYWWVEEITDTELALRIKTLSQDDLELLALIVFDGCTQVEIAMLKNTSKQAINNKLARIKKFLK